ncbi:hypothetical protein MPSEU_000169100 [Mayamaea pseudoterrestris]|nr:hypothetical protein MPSEU_000169100 [Mayamaea pseudoterrestris]
MSAQHQSVQRKASSGQYTWLDAKLANDRSHPSTNTDRLFRTTIREPHSNDVTNFESVSDWLLKTLRDTPHFLVRVARRAVPAGVGGCLLDSEIGRMLVLVGNVKVLPKRVPRWTVSVTNVLAEDESKQHGYAHSPGGSIWELAGALETRAPVVVLAKFSGTCGLNERNIVTTHLFCEDNEDILSVPRTKVYPTFMEAQLELNLRVACADELQATNNTIVSEAQSEEGAHATLNQHPAAAQNVATAIAAAVMDEKEATETLVESSKSGHHPVEIQFEKPKKKPRTKQRQKGKSDPNAVKQPMNGFLAYCNDFRAENPNLMPTEVAKLAGQEWKILDETKKESYLKSAQIRKAKYREDKKSYELSKAVAAVASSSLSSLTSAMVEMNNKSKGSASTATHQRNSEKKAESSSRKTTDIVASKNTVSGEECSKTGIVWKVHCSDSSETRDDDSSSDYDIAKDEWNGDSSDSSKASDYDSSSDNDITTEGANVCTAANKPKMALKSPVAAETCGKRKSQSGYKQGGNQLLCCDSPARSSAMPEIP